jgi:menaquinone-dependent protoporphyrinogen oxidase
MRSRAPERAERRARVRSFFARWRLRAKGRLPRAPTGHVFACFRLAPQMHSAAFAKRMRALNQENAMNNVLVLYATLEGQSRKVAEHAVGHLRGKGLGARLVDVHDLHEPFQLSNYRAVLMVAPVHASFHPRAMVRFASLQREQLAKMPARLLSLTLSQAGVELTSARPEQREQSMAGVRQVTQRFCDATGFDARRVVPIAGCLAYSKYGFLKRQIMRYIAKKAGGSTDTSRDHEYTNFANVEAAVDALCGELSQGRTATASVPAV